MKGIENPEPSDKLDEAETEGIRTSEFIMDKDTYYPTTAMRCWQPGEVEVEDRWGIGSMSSRSEPGCGGPHDRFEILKKSKSRQCGSSRRLHRAGRRVFSCFRHSTINLMVRDKEPITPTKSGLLLVPRSGPLSSPLTSVSGGAHGVNNFMDDAIDRHHNTDRNRDRDVKEPTSPVVNCMGQVRSKHAPKYPKKTEAPKARDAMDRFRRTKSQAPRSPPRVSKSMSCNWKQLLRSNSSSISPSNPPLGEGEPEIDLGRFSSASAGSSEPFCHAGDKKPDKTCMFMQRRNDHSDKLDARTSGNVGENEQRKPKAECDPVFRNLPTLKTKRIESPKWLADESVFHRRQGVFKPSRTGSQYMKTSSTSSSHT